MQTLTLFFGFAIVAIAMENFTAKFHFVKPSDAGAKGHREIKSRAEDGMLYTLYGTTGTEKVTITDGASIEEKNITKTEQRLYAKSPNITIEYTNDECCPPNKLDRNVYFTSEEPLRISTNQNTPNYLKNWNCSTTCLEDSQETRKQMDLLSRMAKVDKCTAVQTMDDCFKCKVLQEGQLCWPGNYTIEFEITNQCKDVTFGGCDIPTIQETAFLPKDNPQECSQSCERSEDCNFWRYHHQSKNCTLIRQIYRAAECNIRAGPTDKKATTCLFTDNDQVCDALIEEECEYNGGVLHNFPKGRIAGADTCQVECESWSDCKYWIYHLRERKCILMKDDEKKCAYLGGPKRPSYDFCHYQTLA